MVQNLLRKGLESLEEGYKGFNIFFYGGRYYTLTLDEGTFNVDKFNNKAYKKCFVGDSVSDIKRLVRNAQ